MYCRDYKNIQPYSSWYEESSELYRHVRSRLREIKDKEERKLNESYESRKKEYERGEEFGLIFDQHSWFEEKTEIDLNKDLIALEAEIKSTLEKILKSIIKFYNLPICKQPNMSMLDSCMNNIETIKDIDMSNYSKEKHFIKEMNINRNKSEHELSSFERIISYEYIHRIMKHL